MRKLVWCLIFVAAAASALSAEQNVVTSFTITGGPVVGGSVQYANGEIKVLDRAPGGMAVYISTATTEARARPAKGR